LVETLDWLLAHRLALTVGPTNRYTWRLDVEDRIRILRGSIAQRDDDALHASQSGGSSLSVGQPDHGLDDENARIDNV